MPKEKTLSLIKPDGVRRNITGLINAKIEGVDLKIIAQKMLVLDEKKAKEFYAEHKEKPFFGELVESITSGPIIAQILEGEDGIAKNREIMGTTDPKEAKPGTIRNLFGLSIGENTVHGSDSPESAEREIPIFFEAKEIFG